MSGLGVILIVGGPVLFWMLAKRSNRQDTERLARLLPPEKRFLLEDREPPSYVK